jgi:hypothetical protein
MMDSLLVHLTFTALFVGFLSAHFAFPAVFADFLPVHIVFAALFVGFSSMHLAFTAVFLYFLHCKKRFASFPSPAGMSLPNSPWAGIMTTELNYSCPGGVWLVTSGWRRETREPFFTVYQCILLSSPYFHCCGSGFGILRSGINIPDHLSESVETIFRSKIFKLFVVDPESGAFLSLDPGWKNSDPG